MYDKPSFFGHFVHVAVAFFIISQFMTRVAPDAFWNMPTDYIVISYVGLLSPSILIGSTIYYLIGISRLNKKYATRK